MQKKLLPTKGCWVRHLEAEEKFGVVIDCRLEAGEAEVCVRWRSATIGSWLPLRKLGSALKVGSEVEDVPYSRTRKSNGIGIVKTKPRLIGGREQHLIDYEELGIRAWTPFETLRYIRSVQNQFDTASVPGSGAAERFRLRNLAYAIEHWHENTGALSHLSIDPLPHQIHLVHHILKSGDLNWLIADDVGLGKTIEVGMILSALKGKREFERVLLVCPAGLVKQWKDEMHYKFKISDFQIYGEDFHINDIRDWRLYNKVIASLDQLKGADHIEKLMTADPWGIVVFDEAHRLSRSRYGLNYNTSERYRLAQNLRTKTDSLLLLSATPHQGKQDKFQSLLELLHPEWRRQIQTLSLNPEILSSMVIRNNKADVTDAEGNFIFKGKIVRSVMIDIDPDERLFDARLKSYLEAGYRAAAVQGAQTKAIGFVMTVYRKLAASSIAAITGALERRLQRLQVERRALRDEVSENAEDSPFETEWEEKEAQRLANAHREEFFAGEITLLEDLLMLARNLLHRDKKISAFIDGLVQEVLKNDPSKKILIFTEYRASQDYIANALSQKFGDTAVTLIHGGMKHNDRQASINHFETDGQFLISTEAGGEGINLQRACHVMVNFDLPWNPMRLVQRVGRLYRYGQQQQVIVVNLQAPHTFDGKILEIMYARIQQVVSDMAHVAEDFAPGLEDDILGQVADLVDVEDILSEAVHTDIRRTESRIEEALKRAREAAVLQRQLFQYFSGYDPDETKEDFRLTISHVQAFVRGMVKFADIEVQDELYKGAVLQLKLPEALQESFGMRGTNLRITFDRKYAEQRVNAQMIDESSPLLQHLIMHAKRYHFNARIACLKELPFEAVLSAVVRWQNDQGSRTRQEYIVAGVRDGRVQSVNPNEFSEWLLSEQPDGNTQSHDKEYATRVRGLAEHRFDERLEEISNALLHPENRQLVSAAWITQNSL